MVTGTYDDDIDDDGDVSEYDYQVVLTFTFSEAPPKPLQDTDFFLDRARIQCHYIKSL